MSKANKATALQAALPSYLLPFVAFLSLPLPRLLAKQTRNAARRNVNKANEPNGIRINREKCIFICAKYL